VDQLQIDMDLGFVSLAYLFHPPSPIDQPHLLVFHAGHASKLGASGGSLLINRLLAEGYTVLGLLMPGYGWNQGPAVTHGSILGLASPELGYDPIRFFLEPVAVALAYAREHHDYAETSMTGISGGGWTTTLYAALDSNVRLALPVAGNLPLWLRVAADKGDAEQYYAPLYEIAGYPDLYVLGSAGAGRAHVQILNRYDSCCFSGLSHRLYEDEVAAVVASLEGGSYRAFLDGSHHSHAISQHAMDAVILPELAGGSVRYADDVDPHHGEFTTIGSWTVSSSVGFGGTQQSAPGGNGDLRARWSVPVVPGRYRVSATWNADTDHASNAIYSVEGGTSTIVDQRNDPSSFTAGGAAWQDLATDVSVADELLTVEISNLADGTVIADGIRIEHLGD
jgi:hypothetical protein